MIRSENTQSVSDFKSNYTKTLDRLNETGEAEILTQNGQARAVLLSPRAFDQLMADAQLARDVAMIRQSHAEYLGGEARPVASVFEELRSKIFDIKRGI
ncbi:type II toxin-antitoxin system Phd/YefM family antitoxin [Mucisphaera calidilacus]|uniref:Antitoxin n=1 Tax=Mucisphaera calidilacus TaxID=2527982 RepID=A0A518C006_9BACT|nr:type II toxin-antitoxin system Phd/YefM family antitoxin [Mucisphaera calidilacus]QDU72551.1 Phd_YefM [Mucisphaera calidilacus]